MKHQTVSFKQILTVFILTLDLIDQIPVLAPDLSPACWIIIFLANTWWSANNIIFITHITRSLWPVPPSHSIGRSCRLLLTPSRPSSRIRHLQCFCWIFCSERHICQNTNKTETQNSYSYKVDKRLYYNKHDEIDLKWQFCTSKMTIVRGHVLLN